MARRRKSRTRTVYRTAKKTYRRARSTGGKFKPYINGAVAGAGAEVGQKFIGPWGSPLAIGAVGYFMKDNTLKTIAGLQAGSMIADKLPVIGGGGSAIGMVGQ